VEEQVSTVRWLKSDDEFERAVALIEAYRTELGEDLSFQRADRRVADLRAHYRAPGGVAGAYVDDTMVGTVCLHLLDPSRAEVKRLYVMPAARGAGIGRELLCAAIEHARRAGVQWVVLDTLERLEAAGRLYASAGFVEIEPYTVNPLPGARYLGLPLPRST
jgi:putative acetyltransferase